MTDLGEWSEAELRAEVERLQGEVAGLRRRKKYGLVWDEDRTEEAVVARCKRELPVLEEDRDLAICADGDVPTNLLIEGDNYHALSVLNYTHAGKIDVIYIDPPYNTGAKDWKYNNNFVDKNDGYRHSKWISMMANRLVLARNLLTENGVLICAIDENEVNRLGLLLESIYKGCEVHCTVMVHNPRGVQGRNFAYTHEYAYFVFGAGLKVIGQKRRETPLHEEFRNSGGESLRTDARNCFYPVFVKNGEVIGFGDVPAEDFHPAGKNEAAPDGVVNVWPIDRNGVERKWTFARQSVDRIKENLYVKARNDGLIDIWRVKHFQKPKTVWVDPKYDASRHGSSILNKLVDSHFDFPKSIHAVKDCLECVIKEKREALVLDFFAGSGTTGHAVSLLNKEDNGARRFILCTNNEGNIAREVCQPRIKAVIKGHADYPDITGIPSNLKYYKTDFVSARQMNPTDQEKIRLTDKAAEMLCIRENTFDIVEMDEAYRIYGDGRKRFTGIIYRHAAIAAFKSAAAKLDGEVSVYVFSFGKEDFAEDFADMPNKVKLQPIPEVILRVYQSIFGERSTLL